MTLFDDLKKKMTCGQCGESCEDIFINPSCAHVICSSCLHPSPPSLCPICQGELIADGLAPDRAFKALWRFHESNSSPPGISPKLMTKSTRRCESSSANDFDTRISKACHKRNAKGETVLHQYCSLGFNKKKGFDLQKLRSMIEDGANPNTYDAGGVTPMHESIFYDELDILKVLLNGGGRVNCYRMPPYTLLHLAVQRYESSDFTEGSIPYKIVKTLLDYGADVNAKDCYHRRPIDLAKNNALIRELLTSYQPSLVARNELLAPDMPTTILSCVTDKASCELMKNFVNRFKVKLLPSQGGLKPEVTHVIVTQDPCEPTFVIRQAILSGCFIVTKNWIEESLKQNCILPEIDFEISQPLVSNSREGFVSRRARVDAKTLMPKLFAGGQFHILSNNNQLISSQEKAQLVKLVELGGGSILSREPKSAETGEGEPMLFHAKEDSMFKKCSIIILFKSEPPMRYNMPHMKHVPVQWLYDCIDTYSIVEW